MDYSFFPTYYSILLFLKVLPIILFILPIILFIVPTILIKYNIINLGTMIVLQNNGLTELYYSRTDHGRPRAMGAPADGIMLV